MADSAARIAEIRAALSSTGKSVSNYSAAFAAGEAPEQTPAEKRAARQSAAGEALLEDEVHKVLGELSKVALDLHGRCAGRNADDVTAILSGLERLTSSWATTRHKLETKFEDILDMERDHARQAVQADLESEMQALKADGVSLQEAKLSAVTHDKALAEAVSALDKARAEKQVALEEAAKNSQAAQALIAELQEKLAAAEASLLAVRSDVAAADVEDMETATGGASKPATVLSLSMTGAATLGATLRVTGTSGSPSASFQWYRVSMSGIEALIGGATRQQYAPEPRDVGLRLTCQVTPSPGEMPQGVTSPGPMSDMEGLAATVSAAAAKDGVEFNCVVVQRNGEMQDRREVHQLEVLSDRVKLKRAGKTRYKESYSNQMQVCGARGGGDAAAQGLFLALSPSLVFMLACESAKQRNAAILIIRMRAAENGFTVLGPKDKA